MTEIPITKKRFKLGLFWFVSLFGFILGALVGDLGMFLVIGFVWFALINMFVMMIGYDFDSDDIKEDLYPFLDKFNFRSDDE